MIVHQVRPAPGAPAEPAAGTRSVLEPAGEPPLRVYRRTLNISLATAGQAERLELDPGLTTLTGRFEALDYDALAPPEASLAAGLRQGQDGDTVIVELDAPRHLRRVRVRIGSIVKASFELELYRMDGETIASDPSATVIPPPIKKSGGPVAAEQALGPGLGKGTGRAGTEFARTTQVVTFNTDFTDARFAVRLLASGSQVPLGPGNLTEIGIRGRPATPRIGLALQGAPPESFWQSPGELESGAPEAEVDAGPALEQALSRQIAAFTEALGDGAPEDAPPPALPAAIEASLVMESDAPCRFTIDALAIAFFLSRESFPGGEPKQVLRFGAERVEQKAIPIDLPAGAAIRAATVDLDADLGTGVSGIGAVAAPARTGAALEALRWLARPLTLTEAISAGGLLLRLLALAGDTELEVALQPDHGGLPSGQELAAARIRLRQAGDRGLYRADFEAPVIVSTAPHWILVHAPKGRAVWLAGAGTQAARFLVRPHGAAQWQEETGIEGIAPEAALIPAGGAAEPLAVSVAGTPAAPIDLPGAPAGRLQFDLAPAIQAAAPAGGPASVTLGSAAPGIVTVYPPRISYDLAP